MVVEATVDPLSEQGEIQIESRKAEARSLVQSLSGRELLILGEILRGCSTSDIARKCGVSDESVELDRAGMMLKLHARFTADAVRIAVEAGINE